MDTPAGAVEQRFNQVGRYQALLDVVRDRKTVRAFAPHAVPSEHYEMILEAARHAPSGANAQPWHFIVIRDAMIKERLGEAFVQEQIRRARLNMKFPTPNYKGMKTAPGLIVIVGDFRFIRAFPILHDDSEIARRYRTNAKRILVQSVAASTMVAHLAAAALGYSVWWVSAIGQEEIQREFKPLLGVPEELSLVDIMCFGPPLNPPYKRWKKRLDQIMSVDRFDMANFLTDVQLDQWVKEERARAMYRDESHVD
jgi:nitroreductase